jgi:hypothetical protein
MMLTRPWALAVAAALLTPPGSVLGLPSHHPVSKTTSTLKPRSPAGTDRSSMLLSPLYQ